MLKTGYFPVVRFRYVGRKGDPGEAVFDKMFCMSRREAMDIAKAEIEELCEKHSEDCEDIEFWASYWDATKLSREERAILDLLLGKLNRLKL